MASGYGTPLYLLALDHRSSFERSVRMHRHDGRRPSAELVRPIGQRSQAGRPGNTGKGGFRLRTPKADQGLRRGSACGGASDYKVHDHLRKQKYFESDLLGVLVVANS